MNDRDLSDPEETDPARLLLAGRHALAAELAASLQHACGPDGGSIVLAVSGGPDSLALLWLAAAIAHRSEAAVRWRPWVVHIDHGLREDSGADAALVLRQAAAAGLRGEVVRVDCLGPGNVSDRARRARYEALEQVARDRGAGAIVTAHHAEDRLESILIGLGRGRGLESLHAMPARRPLGEGLVLARPLLRVPKSALMAFVAHLGLEPAIDPSNADPRRLRARLRQIVVPELEAILPGAAMHAGSMADEAVLAADAIDRWLDEAFGPREATSWPRDALAALPKALRVAGLLRALRELDPSASRDMPRRSVEAVAAAIADQEVHPRRWAIGSSLEAVIDVRLVRLRRRGEEGGEDGQEPLDRQGPRHAAT